MCGGRLRRHAYTLKGNIDISHLFFGFLCLKHLAQIYTSRTFVFGKPDTTQQRWWYRVLLSKGLHTQSRRRVAVFRLVTPRPLYATVDWHCRGHSWGHRGKVKRKVHYHVCLCSASRGKDLQSQANPNYQSSAKPAARIGPTKLLGNCPVTRNWLPNGVHPVGCNFDPLQIEVNLVCAQ